MSVLGYPEANNSDLQIWNNAAFDNGCDSEDSSLLIKPISINPSDSFDSFSSKENQTARFVKTPLAVHSPVVVPFRPLNLNNVAIGNGNSTKKPMIKAIPRLGVAEKKAGEKKIDEEIEEIESEISRLSSKLEALKLEKAEQNAKNLEKSEKVVAAKFMEQKQIAKNGEERLKLRRGLSMGPNEILAVGKSKQSGKQEMTPLQPIQSRRKSCFWKLQDIEEEKLSKGGRRVSSRFSLSPKSRKTIGKAQGTRQAVTTVGSKKGLKKEDGVLTAIQPKKLFVKDGEKSVPAKKPMMSGRVIASRYNQSTMNSAMRKRSLPENDKDESKRCDKKRASSVGKSCGTESCRVKKRWEIPSEIVIPMHLELDEKSPPDTSVVQGLLPKIRAVRCPNETPRDSGPAKRVAELIRKKSFFGVDEEVEEPSVCQALIFAEEFEDEE